METDFMVLGPINLEKSCRSCLQEKDDMHQLFVMNKPQGPEPCLSSIFSSSTQITVSASDGLPCQICNECSAKLYSAYFFRKQCHNTDQILKQYLKNIQSPQPHSKDSNNKRKETLLPSTNNNPEIIDFNTVFNSTIQSVRMRDSSENAIREIEAIKIEALDDSLPVLNAFDKSTQTDSDADIKDDDNTLTLAELKLQLQEQNANQLSCSEYGKTYTRQGCHEKHMWKVHVKHIDEENVLDQMQCQICKLSLKNFAFLKRHLRVVHDKRHAYICTLCDRGFNKYNNFRKHSKSCTGIQYSCNNCSKVFTTEILLHAHAQNKHGEINIVPNKNLLINKYNDDQTDQDEKNLVTLEAKTEIPNDDLDAIQDALLRTQDSSESISHVKEEPLDEVWDRAERETSELAEDCDSVGFLNDTYINDNIENENLSDCEQPIMSIKVKRKVGRPRKNPLTQSDYLLAEDSKYNCDECPKVFQSSLGLKIHKAKHFGEQVGFECTFCGSTFSKLSALKRHKATHGASTPLQCDICYKAFSRQDFLRKHMSQHLDIKPFQCDECPNTFVSAIRLESHKVSHHSEDKAKNPKVAFCATCNRGFTTKQYLSTHIRMHNGDKTFTCDICDKTFNSKCHLREHTKWHAAEKQFLCSECGQQFIRNDYLVIHMRRHKGEKPYKCKFCGKGFPRATDLTVHERYHTGEKTHLCMICGKGFQRQYNLTVHLRVHTGERPYPCSYCNKRFAQSNDLKSHIRRHTGERSSCDVCGEGFIQGYHLTQHKRSVHGIECKSNIRRVEKHQNDERDLNMKKTKKKHQDNHLTLQIDTIQEVIGDINDSNIPAVQKIVSDLNMASMKVLIPDVFDNDPPKMIPVTKEDGDLNIINEVNHFNCTV